MTKPITIMLVEDNPEYRNVISLALKKDTELSLLCSAGTAERALSYIQGLAVSGHPSLILLDLNLPGMSGLDSMPVFQQQAPNTKIIILTQSDRESDVLTAIRRGAAGYLLKSSTISQIKQGIHTVMEGGASLDTKMAKYILAFFHSQSLKSSVKQPLTERELEVLAMLGEGKVKKEIAEKLNVSFFTVASHIRTIYEKLNVTNAPAAITKAYKAGLLPT
jgi:two-component system, NarL family, nitrate/nitrite response regulator NarL